MEETKSECVNIIAFLNANDIKFCPIELNVNGDKKCFINFKKVGESGIKRPDNGISSHNWMFKTQYKTLQEEHPDSEYIAIDTSTISHIDIDDDTEFELDAPYFQSITKKKPHYFVHSSLCVGATRKPAVFYEDGCKIDILSGQFSYCRRDAMVYNSDSGIKDHDVELSSKINANIVIPTKECVIEQFKLSQKGWLKNTGLWKSYGIIWKSLFPDDYETFDEMSRGEHLESRKVPDLYNKRKNDVLWADFPVKAPLIAYQELRKLITKVPALKKKFKDIEENDDGSLGPRIISQMVMDHFRGKIFAFHDGIFFKQSNGLYYQLAGDEKYITSFIRREILIEFALLSDQIPMNWRVKILLYDQKCPLQMAFKDDLYKLGRDQYADVPLKMNANYGYIGFNNGILRLCDMEFSEDGFDDVYMSWSTGYDYPQEPISEEIYDIFETWLDKYAKGANGKVDMKADIKTMIVETLCDKNSKERAFFLMGEGGNGKSVLCNLLCNLLGEYAVNVPYETLTKSIEAEGKNPFIKRMRYKRCVIIGERDDNQKIHSGLFKTLATNKDEIRCRDLHEKLQDQKPFYGTFKIFHPFNGESIQFTGAVDYATKRRITCQEAPNRFVEGYTNIEENILPRDYELINKLELFTPYLWKWLEKDINDYYKNGLPTYSEDFMKSTRDFQNKCNRELSLFYSVVEEDPNSTVTLQEVWGKVSNGTVKKTVFWKAVKDAFIGKHIKKNVKIAGKVKTIDVIAGFKLIDDECDIEQ